MSIHEEFKRLFDRIIKILKGWVLIVLFDHIPVWENFPGGVSNSIHSCSHDPQIHWNASYAS